METNIPRTIALIVGSASAPSLNRSFADALVELGPEAGLQFREVPIMDLPFFGRQFDDDFPSEGWALKSAIESADGLLIVTPEYNRSIPGVLKNAIDWASRPPGKSSFTNKPTGVIGAAKGAISTAVGQAHLKAILASLGAPLVGQPEAYIRITEDFYTEDGQVASEDTRAFLLRFLASLADLVDRWK